MELMQGGQLTELIQEKKILGQKFTDEEAAQVMKCILQAVMYIH
jgi:serine/threonine protein kinase